MSFSNNDGIRDQHLGLSHGILDYNLIVKKIIECKWQGVIGFETRGKTLDQSKQDLIDIYNTCMEKNTEIVA